MTPSLRRDWMVWYPGGGWFGGGPRVGKNILSLVPIASILVNSIWWVVMADFLQPALC